MNKLIACCGLDCEKCDARIATLNNDDSLRQKTAELWSKMNGVEITAEMINCTGCRTDGVRTPFCEEMCEIRKCLMSKSYETCGNCERVGECEALGKIIENNKEAFENLKNAD